ncbi:STAS domain-containing protein [Streptomyces viridiviolaceus]
MPGRDAAVPEPTPRARLEQVGATISLGADLPYALSLGVRHEVDTTVATLQGEIDRDAEQILERALGDLLRHAGRGVDLDLDGVAFMDCSGLNVLLGLRRRAHQYGKTVTIRAAGPAVERLLALADVRSLFAPPVSLPGTPRDAGTASEGPHRPRS